MTVGYSPKLLVEKLGYKPGDSLFCVNPPDWFGQTTDKAAILTVSTLPTTWAHVFVKTQKELRQFLEQNDLEKIEKALWLSWPKKASKIPTDISEQTLRDIILPLGWVDVKVAALDDIWSGLKFTRRRM